MAVVSHLVPAGVAGNCVRTLELACTFSVITCKYLHTYCLMCSNIYYIYFFNFSCGMSLN